MKRTARREAATGPTPRALFPEPEVVRPVESTALRDLMVLTSGEDLVRWNRRRIAEVLVHEAGVRPRRADEISKRIEEQLQRARLEVVSTSLLRELVGAELVSLGLTAERSRHARLGLSLFDVGRVLRGGDEEAATEAGRLDPRATSLVLAGRIKREYALAAVFSAQVATAHQRGDIHLHDLEAIDRPEKLRLTVEDVQRACGDPVAAGPRGLSRRLTLLVARARGHAGREVEIEALDLALAPYLGKASAGELRVVCEDIVGEFGAQADQARRDGGAPVVSFSVAGSWEGLRGAAAAVTGTPAVAARRMAEALIQAHGARGNNGGDGAGALRLVFVIGAALFRTSGHLGVLEQVVETGRRRGVSFRFERDLALAASEPEAKRAARPRRVPDAAMPRQALLGTVSLDLARVGLVAGSDEEAIEARFYALLEVAARAHIEKRVFIEELLARGAGGPLGFLASRGGGVPLSIDAALHPIQLCGLNELAEIATGSALHQSPQALDFAARILGRMARAVRVLKRKHRLRFRLGGRPCAESAARFAKLDLRYHSPKAGHLVKGRLRSGEISHTPGVGFAEAAGVSAAQRLLGEGRLHEIAGFGASSRIAAASLGAGTRTAVNTVLEAFSKTACVELELVAAEAET